jgi:hypothetical protein
MQTYWTNGKPNEQPRCLYCDKKLPRRWHSTWGLKNIPQLGMPYTTGSGVKGIVYAYREQPQADGSIKRWVWFGGYDTGYARCEDFCGNNCAAHFGRLAAAAGIVRADINPIDQLQGV